jgi:hypothetical protein
MSYYDDSSLFVAPNGYKTSVLFAQKPMDANGQLAFTRSNDTATRVGPDGLIEKVRTNLVLQSNSFDTTWTNTNTTVTSGQAGYDGTNNAWLLDSTGGFIQQNISLNGLYTFSVYAKKGTAEGIRLRINAGTDANCYINLNDGTEINAHSGVYLSVVSVGSGWYRIGLAINDSAIVDVRFYPVNLSGFSTTGNILIQDAQLEAGDIATDYIPTTTTAVSVGPVANLPRIDYTGGGCGKLLLEPQRTNLLTYSEQLNNAAWLNAGGTTTANTAVSPSGYQDADTLTGVRYQATFASNTYTLSVFAKKVDGDNTLTLRFDVPTTKVAVFNLNNGTIVGADAGYTPTITNYGNGWYRCTLTTPASTTIANVVFVSASSGASSTYVWGAQLEAAFYATSYIPTLGSASTRGSDAASKTGISSLIGQTEGTLYFEGTIEGVGATTRRLISLSNGGNNNMLQVYNASNTNSLELVVTTAGATQAVITASSSITFGQAFKFAFAYANNDFVFYVNGVQIGIDGSGSVPATSVVQFARGDGNNAHEGTNSQLLLFKTRLSNADLAALTA